MNNQSIRVIGKEFSPSTLALKNLLNRMHLPYDFLDLDFHKESWDLMKFYKIKSLPVLFVGDRWIVGFEESAILEFIKIDHKE